MKKIILFIISVSLFILSGCTGTTQIPREEETNIEETKTGATEAEQPQEDVQEQSATEQTQEVESLSQEPKKEEPSQPACLLFWQGEINRPLCSFFNILAILNT